MNGQSVILEARDLTRRYGDLVAVKDLSLQVYEGEVFGFLGPNGAGKTTSINMMCGLLKPDGGQVLLRGRPLANGDAQQRRRLGMCPQNIIVWEKLTCLEQLEFVGTMYGMTASAARRAGVHLLEELELVEKQHKLARTLSGGMQRRLNLALALVHDPELLVLDEPEAGLDPQSRVRVREYIRSLAGKKTIILTTHNMDEADRLADRVAIIDHGELLVLDTPAALKSSVGAGDTLEIVIQPGTVGLAAGRESPLQKVLADLAGENGHAFTFRYDPAETLLTVRALDAVNLLPAVLAAIARAGFKPGEVHLRENTLEDVFIQLTGRRLRQ